MRVIGTFVGLFVALLLACAWETRALWSLMLADESPAAFAAVAPGVERWVIYGRGRVVLVRLAPGAELGWRAPASDLRLLVLEGAYLHEDASGARRLGPNAWLTIPRGTRHRGRAGDPGALLMSVSR